jgi:hypothetical protein
MEASVCVDEAAKINNNNKKQQQQKTQQNKHGENRNRDRVRGYPRSL